MYDFFLKIIIICFKLLVAYSQKAGYNDTCNNTEECSDHRYQCKYDTENVLRCLCDRFHTWHDEFGCLQMYNATEMANMTVSVTDNIRDLDEEVAAIMTVQLAAGGFVLGMVVFATVAVSAFCVYVHIKDQISEASSSNEKCERDFIKMRDEQQGPTTLSSVL